MSGLDGRSLEAWIRRAREQEGALEDPERGPTRLPAHVGLWLDRCLFEPCAAQGQGDGGRSNDKPGRRALYQAAIDALAITEPPPPAVAAYRPRFARWRAWAEGSDVGVTRWCGIVEAKSRVLLHPATGSTVTEGGLLLHHTYGVPYLPGSALKGLTRRRAQRAGMPEEQLTALFGLERKGEESPEARSDEAGILDFCDALWVPERPSVPEDGTWSPLAFEIVNPHHSAYYATAGKDRPHPLETDEPIPTELLTIRPGTRFLLVLEAPDLGGDIAGEWLRWVRDDVLLPALSEDGIGARTTAGYGRLVALDRPRKDVTTGGTKQDVVRPRKELARVSYQKGNRELRARFADGKVASVRGAAAEELLATIPEELAARLRNGKEVQLVAAWTPIGRERSLVGLGQPRA